MYSRTYYETMQLVGKDCLYSFKNKILIVATGDNISLKTWYDNIKKLYSKKPTTIAINGAGPIGTELAFELSDRKWTVSIYDIFTAYNFLPSRVKSCILSRLEKQNIKLYENTKLDDVTRNLYKEEFNAFGAGKNNLLKSWSQTSTLNAICPNGQLLKDVFIGGDCVNYSTSVFSKSLVPMRTAQNAYDQGVYIAKKILSNNSNNDSYVPKPKFRTLYVGRGMNIVYYDNVNAYVLLPSFLVSLYFK